MLYAESNTSLNLFQSNVQFLGKVKSRAGAYRKYASYECACVYLKASNGRIKRDIISERVRVVKSRGLSFSSPGKIN